MLLRRAALSLQEPFGNADSPSGLLPVPLTPPHVASFSKC